jgi:hypothetical protein
MKVADLPEQVKSVAIDDRAAVESPSVVADGNTDPDTPSAANGAVFNRHMGYPEGAFTGEDDFHAALSRLVSTMWPTAVLDAGTW